MRRTILAAAVTALAFPALADSYPVSGRWGVNPPQAKGPVDCAKLRVIGFNGDQRTDSKGGVPAYRNVSVTPVGTTYRVVDQFTNGMISDGRVTFTLRVIDTDHVEMTQGSTLKLQRCQ
jgi:hypothetical protein